MSILDAGLGSKVLSIFKMCTAQPGTLLVVEQLVNKRKIKSMKRTVLVMIMAVLTGLTMAQEKKSKSETAVIQTSAECGDCKNRIEEGLNYTKGVAFAELDLETKKVTVKFNSKKISLLQVKEKIASIGYSADEVKATQEAIQKLPACCQPGGMKKQKMD